MAQGKSKHKQQRPGDLLKKPKRPHSGVTKKKGGANGASMRSSHGSAASQMKNGFQKAINAKIEEEVAQRAKACETKSFSLIRPGESSTAGPSKSSPHGLFRNPGTKSFAGKLQRKLKKK